MDFGGVSSRGLVKDCDAKRKRKVKVKNEKKLEDGCCLVNHSCDFRDIRWVCYTEIVALI